jgi:hypothetical protein
MNETLLKKIRRLQTLGKIAWTTGAGSLFHPRAKSFGVRLNNCQAVWIFRDVLSNTEHRGREIRIKLQCPQFHRCMPTKGSLFLFQVRRGPEHGKHLMATLAHQISLSIAKTRRNVAQAIMHQERLLSSARPLRHNFI